MVCANTKDGRQAQKNKGVSEEENNYYSRCWGGGGFETVVSTLMAKLQSVSVRISPGRMKPDSVDTVYTYFLGRVRTIFKYVFDN